MAASTTPVNNCKLLNNTLQLVSSSVCNLTHLMATITTNCVFLHLCPAELMFVGQACALTKKQKG